LDEDDDQMPPIDPTDPTISIHALTSIRQRSGKTMQLHVDINGACLLTLLDSSSTHNFVNLEAATHAGLQFSGRSGLQVVVANGDRVLSPGCCRNVSFSISVEHFVVDFYGLTLGSYEMVLGVQWLESLGPMLWDFTKQLLTFVRDGHQVCWAIADSPAGAPAILAVEGGVMADLRLRYEGLFATPTDLPLQCTRCHQIRLLMGTPPVAVRPY
jgi:hypothetical protein